MIAARQGNGYARTVPLQDNDAYQTCDQLELDQVPALSETAVVGDVTPRSIRYDDGRRSWFVSPRDKTVIRAYRERRPQEDIEAGAFPTIAYFYDEKGPL